MHGNDVVKYAKLDNNHVPNSTIQNKNRILKNEKCVCVFLSQLIITSFFNKLVLTKILGDYKFFKLGLLHMQA